VPLIACASSRSTKVRRHSVKGNVSNRQIVTPHKGLLGPRHPRHSGRCPAGNYLPRRAASRWCNSISLRVPRTMLFHIEPKTCPSLWGTPAEECRARLHNGPDARRSCICRHTRYRGTPPIKGPTLVKRSTSPHPSPILIHLHQTSTYRDLPYLTEQVLKFTALSWRSTLPAERPVTIYYSELIAGLLARL